MILDSLIKKAAWTSAVEARLENSRSLIYVPIAGSDVGMTFMVNPAANKVDSGNIVKITNANSTSDQSPLIVFRTYYESVVQKLPSSTRYSGKLESYSITNEFLYDYSFVEGRVHSHGFVAPNPRTAPKVKTDGVRRLNGNGIKLNDECELWGHFTIHEDDTITLDYTYFVCDCQTTAIGIQTGQIYVKTNCGGSGGSTNPACAMTSDEISAAMSGCYSEFPGTQTGGMGYGFWDYDETGAWSEDFTAKAEVFKHSYYLGSTWTWTGEWTGRRTTFEVNSHIYYYWTTVPVYNGAYASGGIIPGIFSTTVTIYGLSGTITADPQYADCRYRVAGTNSITCDGIGMTAPITAEGKVAHLKAYY